MIMNIEMETRRDRYMPLIVCLLMYALCYYMIRKISIPHLYHSFILSSLFAVLVTMIITIKYKISLHMIGAGGLVALIGFLAFYLKVDLQFYFGISVLMAGLTGTARIILNAHKPDEIYTGFLTGFSVVLLTLILN
jgi:hypothetical protein